MFKSLVTLALVTLPLVYGQDSNVTTVMAALTQAKIVPNVVPMFTPRFPLDVRFTVNNTVFPVTAGANLTTAEVVNIPSFAIVSNITAIIGKPYLMAIIDPDAPTPQNPNISEFRHFLGADYISNGSTNGEFVLTNQSNTATLTDFIAPGPPAGSPPHRYVVLCYLQNHTGVTPPANFNASNRNNFNITDFVNTVQGNNFTLLAATFFFVGPDFTNGSVTGIPANSTNSTTGTSPSTSGTSPASSTSGSASGAVGIGMSMTAAVAWSIVGILTATGALLI